jgi:hypothetical protein
MVVQCSPVLVVLEDAESMKNPGASTSGWRKQSMQATH